MIACFYWQKENRMKEKVFYRVAIYLRLSREDSFSKDREAGNGGRLESNSIRSQREIICAYVRKQNNMEIYDTYVDDGYSGSNYDRPGFRRMIKDMEAGKINCVIVKDLSRLGRDYITTGRLIQKIFPAFSVRFIALTDHFDSLTADDNETSLVVPVKNFINDAYARDISCKVRSHQKIKRENGDFIGAFTVYGYRKCSNNKNLLIPDAYAANIVKKIFQWKIAGYSNHAIAELLEEAGILSPLEYKKVKGERFQTGFATGVKAKWSAAAVKRILTNETYIGTLVQGKEEKINYKVKKSIRKPEEEWIKIKDAHEAIISKEDFGIVQELLMINARPGEGEKKAHRYAGLLFCGDCRKPMVRKGNPNKGKDRVFFICSTKNKEGACSRHRISERALNNLVHTALQTQLLLFEDAGKTDFSPNRAIERNSQAAVFCREMEKLHKEQEKYRELDADLYEDLKKQIITEEEFHHFGRIYKKRYQELGQAIERQEQIIRSFFYNEEQRKAGMQIAEPDRLTLLSFVKRILVYEDKRVYLEFRYQEMFWE